VRTAGPKLSSRFAFEYGECALLDELATIVISARRPGNTALSWGPNGRGPRKILGRFAGGEGGPRINLVRAIATLGNRMMISAKSPNPMSAYRAEGVGASIVGASRSTG
jgi:hypothetical protein